MRYRPAILIASAIVGSCTLGFFAGAWRASQDVENAYKLGLAAELLRADSVLKALERQDLDSAQKILVRYAQMTASQMDALNITWPQEASMALQRRRDAAARPK
jgi:hypothetical protein